MIVNADDFGASDGINLGVGLHVVLRSPADPPPAEVERQLECLTELIGQLPTHIDAHHNVHGFNELCCHPGCLDDELVSSDTPERDIRLATLREVPAR